ncbi:SDR family NAD(P)-dependent oxidoreductase [Nocardia sp. CDC160]|uniref:SDR family NAD(P)-dependent oxidoreductase n=1 Tax=Nocardia sp. CDC160 TaxID=3112166 RepID=UPI002DB5A77E|nr:SDR family oxidoreductase [Nocardia sp. CDC160]MEC3917468.1 SDR family oxidoreductase [Nocardia sp. CDC160]
MDLGLTGKVALVAGGSSGIGLAIAAELAAEGAHVAIGARDPARLAAAERTLKESARGRVHATRVDITDAEATRRWIEDVASEFGGLHIVVVSGGTPPTGSATTFEASAYREAVETVLMPAVELVLAALPHLRAAQPHGPDSRWGRILLVASETAVVPIGGLALSGVTRAALVRFAQALAADLGRDGVTVNVLAPSATHTPLLERVLTQGSAADHLAAELAAVGGKTAVGRVARPDEIAALAAFLASERAGYITGTVQLIDGGSSVLGASSSHYIDSQEGTC